MKVTVAVCEVRLPLIQTTKDAMLGMRAGSRAQVYFASE
jgi:hypothetical protein